MDDVRKSLTKDFFYLLTGEVVVLFPQSCNLAIWKINKDLIRIIFKYVLRNQENMIKNRKSYETIVIKLVVKNDLTPPSYAKIQIPMHNLLLQIFGKLHKYIRLKYDAKKMDFAKSSC